jgi:hypothetical protein
MGGDALFPCRCENRNGTMRFLERLLIAGGGFERRSGLPSRNQIGISPTDDGNTLAPGFALYEGSRLQLKFARLHLRNRPSMAEAVHYDQAGPARRGFASAVSGTPGCASTGRTHPRSA